jgi:hypothetical protein
MFGGEFYFLPLYFTPMISPLNASGGYPAHVRRFGMICGSLPAMAAFPLVGGQDTPYQGGWGKSHGGRDKRGILLPNRVIPKGEYELARIAQGSDYPENDITDQCVKKDSSENWYFQNPEPVPVPVKKENTGYAGLPVTSVRDGGSGWQGLVANRVDIVSNLENKGFTDTVKFLWVSKPGAIVNGVEEAPSYAFLIIGLQPGVRYRFFWSSDFSNTVVYYTEFTSKLNFAWLWWTYAEFYESTSPYAPDGTILPDFFKDRDDPTANWPSNSYWVDEGKCHKAPIYDHENGFSPLFWENYFFCRIEPVSAAAVGSGFSGVPEPQHYHGWNGANANGGYDPENWVWGGIQFYPSER